jgi:catechol 2,3-dioxygenase-like lactoylglutathione lyase family enzyme
MLQHVALEVAPDKIEAEVGFWSAVGFAPVEVPEGLGPGTFWLEREQTQVHLVSAESPAIPSNGHAAVVVQDFDETVGRLERAGFEVSRRSRYWGAARAKVNTPGGHLVELMAAPPPPGRAVS